MSSNASPHPDAGNPNPYSREAAPGQGLGEENRELGPDEIAAATAWAASLQQQSNPADSAYAAEAYADPYVAYADPYLDQQPWNPYSADPYAAPHPYAGQHPATNPYTQVNPYTAVTPAQGYGLYTPYPPVRPNHPMAVPSFVISLISYMVCPLLGVVGMVMGINAVNATNAEPEKYGGKGMAIAGLVLGGITTLISLFFVFFIFLGAVAW
ncbi:DUF4190 domain-containing protein [Enemella sp. A6]|uniref:DUF4190 domain-containing protein n=1 Tax=Enemella sp. A6 TaxID=3440152 RepID=UPI003EB6BEA8